MKKAQVQLLKLGEVALLGDGAHTKVERLKTGIPYLTSQNMRSGSIDYTNSDFISEENYERLFSKSSSSTRNLQKDDILFSIIGTIGNVYKYKSDDKFGVSSSVAILRPIKEKITADYLFWILRSSTFRKIINLRKGGSVQGYTSLPLLSDTYIPIHLDIKEQSKIASILSTLDDKISLNNRINSELEEMAKTLYNYWFVQFDFPNDKGKPYKASGGKMVFNEVLKREIPKGWEVNSLSDIGKLTRGVTYSKTDITKSDDPNSIPILRATNINNSTIDLDDMVYVPKHLVSENQKLDKFDIVITMSSGSKDHIGKNAFFYFDSEASYGAFCAKISVSKNILFYTNIFLHSTGFRQYISNVCLGTNINNLTGDHINNCKILVPNDVILSKFENVVSDLYENIGNNLKQNQELIQLRDFLLPLLMNGQVRVK